MKLLIYLLLLLTMPLAAQGKTDEKTLLDCIDKMIENDQYYQGIKEKELKHLKRQAYEAEDDQTRLLFLDSIYHAYSTYVSIRSTPYCISQKNLVPLHGGIIFLILIQEYAI